ncbi:hypothetical protein BZA77DRAFT_294982 [Pyronema omphalodes]|nr:hypothetical protein BZA77DRAFT_294982 [Pyronema omphalodes]
MLIDIGYSKRLRILLAYVWGYYRMQDCCQTQQASQTDQLMNGLVDPLAAEQEIQENAEWTAPAGPLGYHLSLASPIPPVLWHPEWDDHYSMLLLHHQFADWYLSVWFCDPSEPQEPPPVRLDVSRGDLASAPGTAWLYISRMTPTVGYTSNIGATSWDVHHVPHGPITAVEAATDASASVFLPALEASGTSHVASTSSTATASLQQNRKRKWSSEEAATVPDATTGGENDATDGNAPTSVAKRSKQVARKGASSSTDNDEDLDDDAYDADVVLDPEDPDWDMWIRIPSTAKKGPPAKETLVAAKLDWENPVQWSAVPAEKEARAIRRICFWMLWSRARAEKHLDFRSKKWISERERRAADKEDPFRVKRSRKTKDDTVSASTSGVLPEISAVASSIESNSGASNEAPLFLTSSHDKETEYEENDGMGLDEAGLSIGSVRDEQPPITADCPTSNMASEIPPDVNTTMLSDVSPSRPSPEPSLPRALAPFLASVRRTMMAGTAVPAAVLANTASSSDESRSPSEPQNEAQHHEHQQVLDGFPTANEEWLPELCRTG